MIVYLLTSPSGKQYVGITSRTLEARWKEHCVKALCGSDRAICRAIHKHGPESFRVETIQECETWEEACEREKHWIAELRTRAPGGYNLTDGGEGTLGFKPSAEARAKMSDSKKGRVLSAETRTKISAASKGRVRTDEARAKMSARKHTDEARAKMSSAAKGNKANLGRKFSDEHRAKISVANKGRKHTDEARAKMSAAKKGHTTSAETRAKISAAKKGRVVSAETRAKMSAARKGP